MNSMPVVPSSSKGLKSVLLSLMCTICVDLLSVVRGRATSLAAARSEPLDEFRTTGMQSDAYSTCHTVL